MEIKLKELDERKKRIKESDNPEEEWRKFRIELFQEMKKIEQLNIGGENVGKHLKPIKEQHNIPDTLPEELYIPIKKKPKITGKEEL